jgi:hypothetical protein
VNFTCFLQAPSAEEVGIAPDKFQQWPHDLNETTKLALYPQPDDFLFDLFDRGRADALAWAQQQGFPAEVLQRLTTAAPATGAVQEAAAATAAGDGQGGRVAARVVPADAVGLPAELRVARRQEYHQQQQMPGLQQQQQQEASAAVVVAEAGAEQAAAGVTAAVRGDM